MICLATTEGAKPVDNVEYLGKTFRLFADGTCHEWNEEQEMWVLAYSKVHITTEAEFGDNGLLILERPIDIVKDHEVMVCIYEWAEHDPERVEQIKDDFIRQTVPAEYVDGCWEARESSHD